ncbi:MAG: hypothetical protein ABH873_07275 [Candidatus Firestonebacteria bacterium]
MRKILIYLGVMVFFANIVFAGKKGENRNNDNLECIKDLSQDISTLNLINGLNLTTTQMTGLINIAKESASLKDKVYKEYSEVVENTKNSYEILKAQLITKGAEVTPEIQKAAARWDRELKEAREKFEEDLKGLEEKVSTVLSAGQMQIISDFVPCLIPPKSLKNPTRAGQAYDSGPIEQLLKRLREVKDDSYNKKVNEGIEKFISREEEKFLGPLDEEAREKEKQRLLSIINKAKAMDDAEFELNKEELAKEADLKYEKNVAEKTIRKLSKAHDKGIGKVGRYFLNDKIIPILEQKLQIAKSFKKPGKTNLDKVE